MLRTLISAPAMPSEPQTSVFLQEQRQQIQSGTGIGREDPANVSGYIYRDDSPPAVPDRTLPVSNIFDDVNNEGIEPQLPDYDPQRLPVSAWSRDGQSGSSPATSPRPVGDQVPYGLEGWTDAGGWGIGAMPYPSEYGISELVSVTPQKDPILLGPAGKMGMGWPQTVTTPPWIDIGDSTPADVIGLGAGINLSEGSWGA